MAAPEPCGYPLRVVKNGSRPLRIGMMIVSEYEANPRVRRQAEPGRIRVAEGRVLQVGRVTGRGCRRARPNGCRAQGERDGHRSGATPHSSSPRMSSALSAELKAASSSSTALNSFAFCSLSAITFSSIVPAATIR